MPSISTHIKKATSQLTQSSPTSRLDAEILLAHILKKDKIFLLTDDDYQLSEDEVLRFEELIERRTQHEPVAYLTGTKEFYGLDFNVTPDVLIPRPETELLVELALKQAQTIDGVLRILEWGTGSGCISVSIAKKLRKQKRDLQIIAIEKSKAAIEIAKGNIAQHGLSDLITLRNADWFNDSISSEYDLILSNPPYVIPNDPQLSPECRHEPGIALFEDDQGLRSLKRIAQISLPQLSSSGALFFECGCTQAEPFKLWLHEKHTGLDISIFKDLAKLDRVVCIRHKSNLINIR